MTYTASKAKDKGRERYSVIFRHPARLDGATGRPGRRVRRGLGTTSQEEADRLVAELDVLLANEEYWTYAARGTAEGRFDPRIVSVFFDGMEPTANVANSLALREAAIALPGLAEGYRRVALLGTTGAGKTTLVRQLIGTDPVKERFPSTSTAKTTVADTEIVTRPGTFSAAVTFFRRDEIVDHLTDCASRAALLTMTGAPQTAVRNALLDHENQRFRFSYTLGRHTEGSRRNTGSSTGSSTNHGADAAGSRDGNDDEFDEFDAFADLDDFDDLGGFEALTDLGATDATVTDDGGDGGDGGDQAGDTSAPGEGFDASPETLPGVDLTETQTVIDNALGLLDTIVRTHEQQARDLLAVETEEDERQARELLEEELDKMLRADESFNRVVDSLLEEIEKRFDALTVGDVTRDRQGWPASWTWECDDRVEFLRAVNRFTSNHAKSFGHLLTPLVDGIRVAGPFFPTWGPRDGTRLVLVDGEGLGHTTKSATSLPTATSHLIERVDAVLLVDHAGQPVQTAPASAIQSLLTGGQTEKLIFCFTHFDSVSGDNLTTPADRARHVVASVENFLSSVRTDFSPRAERAVRRRLENARVFLGGLDKALDPRDPDGRQSIVQLRKLLAAIDKVVDKPELGESRPVYDKTNLVLGVTAAVGSFHRRWNALLGVAKVPEVDREHWTRVKALNRRFAEGTADQYDTLRPASDLRELLKDEIYRTLEEPLSWDNGRPADDVTVTAIIDELSRAIATRLHDPIKDRLAVRPIQEWQASYALSGTGSTFRRANRIADEVFSRQVPVPGATPSPDRNEFLHSVVAAVSAAADEVGARLQ
ncbi:hypothetical protein [Nocardioides zeae]